MRKLHLLAILLLACILLFSCGDSETPSSESEDASLNVASCTVDILKIGKADCIVIRTENSVVMIDSGESKNVDDINAFMKKKGYDSVDTLILTHPDKDHIGGASEIISTYGVKTVIESLHLSPSEEYTLYHATMDELGMTPIILNGNYSFTLDGCEFSINAPKKQKYSEKQSNNSSLVVSLTCGQKRLLFCGDAMELRIAELVEAEIGEHDFIKLPYHGNYLENYRDLLDEVKAKYGVITCSGKNPASDETLSLLDEYGMDVFLTKDGTVSIQVEENEIHITQNNGQ